MASRAPLRLVEEEKAYQPRYKRFEGELWTAQQRQMHSLHYVVSYRASFKPELPDFCIRRYSKKGDVVYDPFSGRGTTALQANLLGRIAIASDVNPLAVKLTKAKTKPVGLDEVVLRLNEFDLCKPTSVDGYNDQFAPFYHPKTFLELVNLKSYIEENHDRINGFIELLAVSRLHGHSPGFFSVYSFPQISIPPDSQRLINKKRGQVPEYRSVAPRLIKKAAHALRDGFNSEFLSVSRHNLCEVSDSRSVQFLDDSSIDLIVCSPPFLDKVDYLADNWLEFWFTDVDPELCKENVVMCRSVAEWSDFIGDVLAEMLRVLKPGAHAVMEVGEVESDGKMLFLDEIVAERAEKTKVGRMQFSVEEVLINKQDFTKLANCFKVTNNRKGTNTNRMVVLRADKRGTSSRTSRCLKKKK